MSPANVPLTVRTAQAFGEWPPLDNALGAVADVARPVEDRAALYAALYAVQSRIRRVLGLQPRTPGVKDELLAHMQAQAIRRLGPLAIRSEAIGVAYPCNDAGNWQDAGVQDALSDLAGRSDTSPFVRRIPAHLEIDPLALGEAYVRGDPAAQRLYRELAARGWRTEEGRRAALRVTGA